MTPDPNLQRQRRANNRRTASWLVALVVFFFALLFVKRLWMH